MLTKSPINSGAPAGVPRVPLVAARLSLHDFLTNLDGLTALTAAATGYAPECIAEWAGTVLIRWAEQDRAQMRSDTAERSAAS